MRIAVTGATGFLGRYLVGQLVQSGHLLRSWHRPTSDRSGFDGVASAVEWQVGQLGDETTTQALVRGVDALVHAAVDWDGPRNRRREREQGGEVERFLDHNLMGSLRLFLAAYQA